jgi:hypothetical protein
MKTQKQHNSLFIITKAFRSGKDFPMDCYGRCMCFCKEMN